MAKEENPGVHLGPQYTWRSQGTPLCGCHHHAHTHKDPDQRQARQALRREEQNGLTFEKRFKGDTQVTQSVKNLPAMQETWVRFLDQGDPLEKEMATHSSILAWEIPWTEEPGESQAMGSQSRTRLSN